MLFFEETSNILEDFYKILSNLFGSINWDIIFFAGLAFEVLFAVFFLIKSRFSYEVRVVKKLLKINNWLNKNRNIDQNNLIEFNNMMKATPKHLRYYWHEYMLNRDKAPSFYMSTYNLVEKPLKSSSFNANLKNFLICTIVGIGLILVCSLFKIGAADLKFNVIALTVITPMFMILLYAILVMIMRSGQNMNIESLYQYVHYFGRFLDRAVTTMPEYVDFEVLFTPKEIKKGIPVLNEYLEKRARQEQEELEKARINAVEHETYDFSSTGINGSLILERAINESETFINIRSRLLSEIQQIEDEMDSLKRTYENSEKDYQKKMEVSKENVDRLRKQQEETTNRIENNYIKKQQADEIKKQEQLEKDHDSSTLRFNQEIESLTNEITTRQKELEERRAYVENVMKAEYQTFSTKLYKSMSTILEEEQQDEKDELIEIKDQISEDLQNANEIIAEKDDEINQLHALLQANNIDYNAYMGYASQTLQKESKRNKKHKKGDTDEDVGYEPLPSQTSAINQTINNNLALDPNLIPLEKIPEEQRQYGEDGGFYDPNGYYRYPNGTYFTASGEYHDEFGGWYEADGVTYHEPKELEKKAEIQNSQQQDGHYGDDGNYYYPNGAYYTPDGRYFDEFGGWYEKDGVTYHPPEENDSVNQTVEEPATNIEEVTPAESQQDVLETDGSLTDEKPVRKFEDVPEEEREYGEDGGFFDNEGYYYYPNGAYFTPDGRYFDEFGGWYEADGETYHEPENTQQTEKEMAEDDERKKQQDEQKVKNIEKLKNEFNINEENIDEHIEQPVAEVIEQEENKKLSKKKDEDDDDDEQIPEKDITIDESLFQEIPEESKEESQNDVTEDNSLVESENQETPVKESVDKDIQNQPVTKKRGRPKKATNEEAEQEIEQPKKSRGRPRKTVDQIEEAANENYSSVEDDFTVTSNLFEQPNESEQITQIQPTTEKKGRGRPKKQVTEQPKDENKEKRGRGRPKKSVSNTKKSNGEFDELMSSSLTPEIDELDELNEKIADENKRLAEHQEERDKQLTEALFQLSSDDEDNDKK